MDAELKKGFETLFTLLANPPAENYAFANSKYGFRPEDAATKGIDYSQVVTEPDCVLSMRDIYNKYVATGTIAGLAGGGTLPMISDECDEDDANETDFEENLDILRHSQEVKRRVSARTAKSEKKEPVQEVKEELEQPSESE